MNTKKGQGIDKDLNRDLDEQGRRERVNSERTDRDSGRVESGREDRSQMGMDEGVEGGIDDESNMDRSELGRGDLDDDEGI